VNEIVRELERWRQEGEKIVVATVESGERLGEGPLEAALQAGELIRGRLSVRALRGSVTTGRSL
jgi:hypothetical protein